MELVIEVRLFRQSRTSGPHNSPHPNAWTTNARITSKARSTKHANPKRAPAGSQPFAIFALRCFREPSRVRDPDRRACAIQRLAPARSPAFTTKPGFDTTDAKLNSFATFALRDFAPLRDFEVQHVAPTQPDFPAPARSPALRKKPGFDTTSKKFDFTEKVELQH